MVTKSVQESKDCCSAMAGPFVTMVLVITLLTLFAVKWDLLEEGAGEIQTSGAPSKRLLILLLMTFRVVVENGAHALTIS